MMKYIEKRYGAFDNAVMKGVNTAVRAYNWTTGKTKADLANTLLIVAPVMESVGFISKPLGAFPIIFMLAVSHFFQKMNRTIEEDELRAMDNGLLNANVEYLKNVYGAFGAMWIATGAWQTLAGFASENKDKQGAFGLENSTISYLLASASAIRGASHYVMRADYLPPRKNCVKRGLENLVALYEANQAEPVPLPAPMPTSKMHVLCGIEERI